MKTAQLAILEAQLRQKAGDAQRRASVTAEATPPANTNVCLALQSEFDVFGGERLTRVEVHLSAGEQM